MIILDMTPKARARKAKTNKRDYIKKELLCCEGREGNGHPPQCSCLENPREGRASVFSPACGEQLARRERLQFHFSLSCIGGGNGHPPQCSCLENPRDGGAWWAAIYGVTELDTTEVTWQQQCFVSASFRRCSPTSGVLTDGHLSGLHFIHRFVFSNFFSGSRCELPGKTGLDREGQWEFRF